MPTSSSTLLKSLFVSLPVEERMPQLIAEPIYSAEELKRHMLDGKLQIYREGQNSKRNRVVWVPFSAFRIKRPVPKTDSRFLRAILPEQTANLRYDQQTEAAELMAYLAATGGVGEPVLAGRPVTPMTFDGQYYFLYWGKFVGDRFALYLVRPHTPYRVAAKALRESWVLVGTKT